MKWVKTVKEILNNFTVSHPLFICYFSHKYEFISKALMYLECIAWERKIEF